MPRQLYHQAEHEDLFQDVSLRLERTNGSKALVYPFRDKRAALAAVRALGIMFAKRVRKGQVKARVGTHDGGPALFVWRGPNYVK